MLPAPFRSYHQSVSRTHLVLVLATGLIACGQAAIPTSPNAINVSGVLNRGPVAACPTNEACDPPAVATFVVFSRAGYPDVRTSVGAGGTFALHLDPGAYSIGAAPPPPAGKVRPDSVRVPAQGTVTLALSIG